MTAHAGTAGAERGAPVPGAGGRELGGTRDSGELVSVPESGAPGSRERDGLPRSGTRSSREPDGLARAGARGGRRPDGTSGAGVRDSRQPDDLPQPGARASRAPDGRPESDAPGGRQPDGTSAAGGGDGREPGGVSLSAGRRDGVRGPRLSGVRGGGTLVEAFRAAGRAWTTGVAVVTARHGDEVFAKTVSSLCTLSLDPLLISVAVRSRSPLAGAVRSDGRYAVSVLAAHQEPLARHFASPGAGRALGGFTVAPMRSEVTGAPVLEDCLAWFDCRLHTVLPGGDHAVLVGRVTAADADPGEPLLYHQGGYRSLAPLPLPSTGALT